MLHILKRVLALAVIASFFVIAWQHQALADWWFLRNYEPDETVAQLADESYMSDYGRRLYYVSDPEINDKRDFNVNCPELEESFVLGCYHGGRIYLLEVDRPELDGVMEVTAAHEMLHAAYGRLSNGERERITELLEDAYDEIDSSRMRDLIRSYESQGGENVRQNELHSILPTQIAELPSELDEYYGRYFTDRQAVVELYKDYESVFVDLNRRIDEKRDEINEVRSELGSLETAINSELARVRSLNRQLERLDEQDDVEEYNRLVPEQNEAVDNYNSLVDSYRHSLSHHNSLVDEINRLVLLQNDLVNSMDSSFEPL